MADNWDDEDYDPTTQMADKIASLGLDDVIRQQQQQKVLAVETSQQKDLKVPSSLNNGGGGGKQKENGAELTEREKREAQLRADGAAAMDLFGLAAERKEPTYEGLRSKEDFQAFADKLGEQFEARRDDPNYLLFVNSLVDHLTTPMNKLQLQIVMTTIQVHLDVHLKREEEELKRQQEQSQKKETKKKKNKQLEEDVIEDDYDDYDEQLHRY
uniref:Eukaryotic translation initiation factor 3 30 kDa subunit n=1 Tax=Globodera rostochiensis TaxID=31243 RepID=A0A914GS58_GLORO